MGKEDPIHCSNKSNHVSAWPAFDRKLCPNCGQVYVRKEGAK